MVEGGNFLDGDLLTGRSMNRTAHNSVRSLANNVLDLFSPERRSSTPKLPSKP
jgi:hypothetical protein